MSSDGTNLVEWRNNNPGYDKTKKYIRNSHYRSKFGITLEDYNNILIKQDYRCAVCNTHQSELKIRLAVDHNHKTGQIRGLLCNGCNTGLGMFKESVEIIDNLKVYLLKYK